MCGNQLGQMIHQQVRACATRFNAYTCHRGKCTHCRCHEKIETNEHVIAHCPRYAEARAAFNRKTGVTLSGETYVSVMALDYKKLQVGATTLAKAVPRGGLLRAGNVGNSVSDTSQQGKGGGRVAYLSGRNA